MATEFTIRKDVAAPAASERYGARRHAFPWADMAAALDEDPTVAPSIFVPSTYWTEDRGLSASVVKATANKDRIMRAFYDWRKTMKRMDLAIVTRPNKANGDVEVWMTRAKGTAAPGEEQQPQEGRSLGEALDAALDAPAGHADTAEDEAQEAAADEVGRGAKKGKGKGAAGGTK